MIRRFCTFRGNLLVLFKSSLFGNSVTIDSFVGLTVMTLSSRFPIQKRSSIIDKTIVQPIVDACVCVGLIAQKKNTSLKWGGGNV